MNIETKIVHGYQGFDEKTGALSFPIYQSATFKHPGLNQSTGYDYSREKNPTREVLEKTIALLERGKYGFAFSSGMAAISAVIEIFSNGDHIIVSDDLYGGSYRLFEQFASKRGIEFSYIDTTDIEVIKKNINKNTAAVFIETPSNPMMKVTDIAETVIVVKEYSNKILTIVDNTFLTPYFQRPLTLGADIVIHSGTKYLGGHNDTLAGFVVVDNSELNEKLFLTQKSIGSILAPFDSWLLLRSIKTLALRLEKQQQNALKIAEFLKTLPQIEKVYFAGLPEHPQYEISKKQASGFGAMVSFTVKDITLITRILENVKIFSYAESLGGVESLITYPILQTHAAIPKQIREKLGVTDHLLRMSVGIEAVDDLIDDIKQSIL